MITPMRVTVFAAAIAAAAPLVAQPVKAATAVVQPQSTVSDLGSEKPVVEVGWRGRGGYGGVYRRGGYGYRRGGYGYRRGYAYRGGYGNRRALYGRGYYRPYRRFYGGGFPGYG